MVRTVDVVSGDVLEVEDDRLVVVVAGFIGDEHIVATIDGVDAVREAERIPDAVLAELMTAAEWASKWDYRTALVMDPTTAHCTSDARDRLWWPAKIEVES